MHFTQTQAYTHKLAHSHTYTYRITIKCVRVSFKTFVSLRRCLCILFYNDGGVLAFETHTSINQTKAAAAAATAITTATANKCQCRTTQHQKGKSKRYFGKQKNIK